MNTNIPLPIIKIIEVITYSLPKGEGQAFSDAVTMAAEGRDLSLAHWAFLGGELRAIRARLDLPNHIQVVIDTVIFGMDLRAAGKKWHEAVDVAYDAFGVADAAASPKINVTSAAFSAAFTAQAAAFSVDTSIAANAAAGYAAHAYTGGYIQARQRQRDALLEIIENAKAE